MNLAIGPIVLVAGYSVQAVLGAILITRILVRGREVASDDEIGITPASMSRAFERATRRSRLAVMLAFSIPALVSSGLMLPWLVWNEVFSSPWEITSFLKGIAWLIPQILGLHLRLALLLFLCAAILVRFIRSRAVLAGAALLSAVFLQAVTGFPSLAYFAQQLLGRETAKINGLGLEIFDHHAVPVLSVVWTCVLAWYVWKRASGDPVRWFRRSECRNAGAARLELGATTGAGQ